MRIVILDAATCEGGRDCWAALRELGDVAVHPRSTSTEARQRLARTEIVLTNKVAIGEAELAAAPRLRYVGILATGSNIIDLAACRRRAVAVANVPGYSTDSVAQLVFAFLLHLHQDVAGHAAAVATGTWSRCPDFCFTLRPLRELAGQTVAVVGSGAIGGAVARIAHGFGMRTLACAVPGSVSRDRVPLAEALPLADAVTLHCPLTPATAGLVDDRFLAALRPGAVLINTSRGGLIDVAALVRALDRGHLAGAGLDVLESEPPPPGHPLLQPGAAWRDRVLVTPHLAWATVEARSRLVAEAAANLRAFLAGETRNRLDRL